MPNYDPNSDDYHYPPRADGRDGMNDLHLGDGVYASFDGYQIWLAANHHENKVIALEPRVLENLIEYAERIGILKASK